MVHLLAQPRRSAEVERRSRFAMDLDHNGVARSRGLAGHSEDASNRLSTARLGPVRSPTQPAILAVRVADGQTATGIQPRSRAAFLELAAGSTLSIQNPSQVSVQALTSLGGRGEGTSARTCLSRVSHRCRMKKTSSAEKKIAMQFSSHRERHHRASQDSRRIDVPRVSIGKPARNCGKTTICNRATIMELSSFTLIRILSGFLHVRILLICQPLNPRKTGKNGAQGRISVFTRVVDFAKKFLGETGRSIPVDVRFLL